MSVFFICYFTNNTKNRLNNKFSPGKLNILFEVFTARLALSSEGICFFHLPSSRLDYTVCWSFIAHYVKNEKLAIAQLMKMLTKRLIIVKVDTWNYK